MAEEHEYETGGTAAGPLGVGLGKRAPGVDWPALADAAAEADGDGEALWPAVELLPHAARTSPASTASAMRVCMGGRIVLQAFPAAPLEWPRG